MLGGEAHFEAGMLLATLTSYYCHTQSSLYHSYCRVVYSKRTLTIPVLQIILNVIDSIHPYHHMSPTCTVERQKQKSTDYDIIREVGYCKSCRRYFWMPKLSLLMHHRVIDDCTLSSQPSCSLSALLRSVLALLRSVSSHAGASIPER